jgi:hypothetical protein
MNTKGLGGRRGRTRTGDPLLRRQMLYPPELRAHIVPFLILNHFQLRNHPDSCIPSAKLYQNCFKTPSVPLANRTRNGICAGRRRSQLQRHVAMSAAGLPRPVLHRFSHRLASTAARGTAAR